MVKWKMKFNGKKSMVIVVEKCGKVLKRYDRLEEIKVKAEIKWE